jgi:hypothetical protein
VGLAWLELLLPIPPEQPPSAASLREDTGAARIGLRAVSPRSPDIMLRQGSRQILRQLAAVQSQAVEMQLGASTQQWR